VKRTAVYQLGEVGDPRARAVLLAALEDPALADSKQFALNALAALTNVSGSSGTS
jgi:hypothetical protein